MADSSEKIEDAMEKFRSRLRDAGLKSTKQREIIVHRFFELDRHISTEEMLIEVKAIQPSIGYATVYRTLKLLKDQGLAIPKNFGDGQTRYDPIFEQDPEHDHLICIDCRKIIEFNDAPLLERITELALNMGYTLKRKKIELYAECNLESCPSLASNLK